MPTITRQSKNAADIRIVIDALDLLAGPTRCDEFVIASGDADFTPLLYRLRAQDRRIVLISPGFASTGFTAVADRCLGFDQLEQLVRPEGARPLDAESHRPEAYAAFEALVRAQYEAAQAPLNLASLAHEVSRAIPGARASGWFGHGTFTGAIGSLGLADAQLSQHHLWDGARHVPPPPRGVAGSEPAPDPAPSA